MRIDYLHDYSSEAIQHLLATAASEVVFIGDPRMNIDPGARMFERMAQVMRDTGAGWVYADAVGHARVDYQRGSIRDNFDFGPLIAVSVQAARESLGDENWKYGALYDMRLRISERRSVVRIPEPLYSASTASSISGEEERFAYVDPRNRDYQLEMERIATAHLKRIGAWLPPEFKPVSAAAEAFPVRASVVIPVRNRERTISDAIGSALSQNTGFEFNVIVVDNHSTDGTTSKIRAIHDSRVKHLRPARGDLGIGGCWNEAIHSEYCGRYAVQLDSDDLYISKDVLMKIVSALETGPYAMAVGSYKLVDFSLREVPPGLIDHREWTRENGRNNALRINGFGAPRAFDTSVLREVGFPNVSYGEDYAVALRICRDYEVARIYEPLYLCRRWEGNSDNALPRDVANRYDQYKDWLRSNEIAARMHR